MKAILSGKPGTSSRGDRIPKSVADKYDTDGSSKDLPESKGKEHKGGKWSEKHHKDHADKKKKLKKSLEDYLLKNNRRGAGCLVVDKNGHILLGRRTDNGMWATPGGHVEQDESFAEAALRELREETGLVGKDSKEILSGTYSGYSSKTFLVTNFRGKLKSTVELSAVKFFAPHELPWQSMTAYTFDAVKKLVEDKLQKSKDLQYMLAGEAITKAEINWLFPNNAPTPEQELLEKGIKSALTGLAIAGGSLLGSGQAKADMQPHAKFTEKYTTHAYDSGVGQHLENLHNSGMLPVVHFDKDTGSAKLAIHDAKSKKKLGSFNMEGEANFPAQTMDPSKWSALKDSHSAIGEHFKDYLGSFKKNDGHMVIEKLNKNIIRSGGAPSDVVYPVTHGDALRLIGNGTFRMLRRAVEGMTDEDFREVQLDTYKLCIRKHVNDVYSGRVIDGHKQIHQFINHSLPSLAAELMSIFEWYSPDDEPDLEILDENQLDDSSIEGGIDALMDHYKKHNIVNIYGEMENIREEIRNGNAIDLQQVEHKIMKLFDKLESTIHDVVDKHNSLMHDSGANLDDIEAKLKDLQDRVEQLNKKPATVQAYSPTPDKHNQIYDEYYTFLPKPSIAISPSGHMTISFGSGWTVSERENFLNDMKARVIKMSDKG